MEKVKITKNTKVKTINDVLSAIYNEDYVFQSIVENIDLNMERHKVLRYIFSNIDELKYEELSEKIYIYGSLVPEENLLARQMFLWLIYVLEEKKALE